MLKRLKKSRKNTPGGGTFWSSDLVPVHMYNGYGYLCQLSTNLFIYYKIQYDLDGDQTLPYLASPGGRSP